MSMACTRPGSKNARLLDSQRRSTTKLATLINTGSGQTAIQHGRQMLGMLRASRNLPAPAANKSTGILAKRGQGDGMNRLHPGMDVQRRPVDSGTSCRRRPKDRSA